MLEANMNELARCPCGEIPEKLRISDGPDDMALVSGCCCGNWSIAFSCDYKYEDLRDLAEKAWNSAPRWCDTTRGQEGC